MPDIKQITLPSGTTYDLVDQGARNLIAAIESSTGFLGVTTTAISEGSTANPITIGGNSVTAKVGNIVTYGSKEFVFNYDNQWQEFGDLSSLGALAFKDNASGSYKPEGTVSQPTFTGSSSTVTITSTSDTSGNYTPAGTVSQPTFTGKSMTSTGKFTPSGGVTVSTKTTTNKTATVSPAASGTATYTPDGTVGTPTITVTPNTAKIHGMATQGTLPAFSATVEDEVLTLGWNAGTLPTQSTEQTFVTGIKSATSSQPSWTGTGVRLVTGNIAVPSEYTASFSGSEGDVSVSGTTTGTVSQPTFTGTKVKLSGTTTASGSVSQPTFTGTSKTVTVS